MKTIKTTALIFLLFLMGYTVNAQGTETRTPGNFTKIESGGSWEVYVKIGNRDEVRVESGNIALDKVITEVNDGRLKLGLERGNYRNVDLTFYVTVRDLEGLGASGSGAIFVESDVTTDRMAIGVSGSGLIKMQDLNAGKLSVGISGSGDVQIEGGEVEELEVGQSGSGDFEGIDLVAGSVKIGKSGSGETWISVQESMKVASSGSGNIYYRGNPEMRGIAMSGSTKLIKK
ncbi:head GIN domain-containing protein [Algoriphagus sp. CAU 1675]|uniref:head GIN domain-containing protein n=1 Tax=Algoriphagus sp. CAU 1675 TaxID=3032597 RepID=UPI0023DA9553|nr:head GIN domain-containing protein [Algoriphagus sp. CAU 1675]MDF2158131.1 DUF2807 domain-containing protein [Algoriphagus sp. CAU 1675]